MHLLPQAEIKVLLEILVVHVATIVKLSILSLLLVTIHTNIGLFGSAVEQYYCLFTLRLEEWGKGHLQKMGWISRLHTCSLRMWSVTLPSAVNGGHS